MINLGHSGQQDGPEDIGRGEPIVPSPVTIVHYPAPTGLQRFVTTLFTLRSDALHISDVLPAAVGYLAIVQCGRGTIRFVSGHCGAICPETLLTPTSAAAALEIAGPWHMVAAALSPLGWAALTGLDAARNSDRVLDAGEVFGAEAIELGARLRETYAAAPVDGAAMVAELAAFIGPRLRPLNPRHLALVARVADWLSSSFDPDLADLQQSSGYSARQVQRLVERYFGSGPKQLARKYRALRVAALLQSEETSEERIAELMNLFYDQSHLIREMRHFLGRTPARLGKGDDTVLAAATALRNYRDFKPNVARIPGD